MTQLLRTGMEYQRKRQGLILQSFTDSIALLISLGHVLPVALHSSAKTLNFAQRMGSGGGDISLPVRERAGRAVLSLLPLLLLRRGAALRQDHVSYLTAPR